MATVLLIARLVLFGVFALAGMTKLADRAGSRQMLVAFGMPNVLAHPLSLVLPIAELIVAAGLLPAASVRIAAVAAFSLLVIFIVAIGVNLARGRTPDCNCFGQLHAAPIGWSTLARNTALAVAAGLLIWDGENAAFSIVAWLSALTTEQRLVVLFAGAALGLGFGVVLLMQMLRFDGVENRLGIRVPSAIPNAHAAPAGLLVGSSAPSFRLKGSDDRLITLGDMISPVKPLLLIFTKSNCDACQALRPEIGRWQQAHGALLRLVLLIEGPVAENAGEPWYGATQVLFQRQREVTEAYRVRGTPSAVIIMPDGSIGSAVAEGVDAIRALVAHATTQSRPPRHDPNGSSAGAPELGLHIDDAAPALAADFNSVLTSLTNTPTTEYEGSDTLKVTVTSSDGANRSATPGSASTVITVNPAAEAASAPPTLTLNENATNVAVGTVKVGPLAEDNNDTVSAVAAVSHGTLEVNASSLPADVTVTNNGSASVTVAGGAADQKLQAPIIADQTLHDAIVAYRAGKLREAEVLCNRILEQQPNHIGVLQFLAVVAANKAAPRRGIEFMEKAVALCPDSVDSHIGLARLLMLEKRHLEAIAALKKAIELEPRSAGAYNDLGLIYVKESDVANAIDCFDRAIAINPNLAFAHFNRGIALEQQGDYAGAIESFRRVVSVDPNFAEAHAKLGNLLLFEHDRAGAFECLHRAAALRPDSVLGLTSQAKILMEEEKAAAAEELVRRAIDLQPRNSYAYCLLGTILMELGRLHDAAASFDLALALNRRQTAAYYNLVNVKKLIEADRPLLAQIEWMLKHYKLPEDDEVNLHFSLGKAYDDLGEYNKAMEHFDQANRVRHRGTSFNQPRAEHVADRVIASFSVDFFTHNAALGSDWEVPILILGMPRSGTTLVEQILSSHPEVAAGGEILFWAQSAASFRADATGAIDPAWVSKMAPDYRSLLTKISPTARRVTDKSPHNYHFLGLIHAVFPRARIIHCRRHPVDTSLSIYFQDFARRMDFAYDRDDLVAAYRQYLKLMAHWRGVLPADRFLEIQYEELVANREAMTRKLIAFCGLDWNDACLHSEQNRRSVRTASVWQARQPVYQTSVARWRHYEPWLGSLGELLSDGDRDAAAENNRTRTNALHLY